MRYRFADCELDTARHEFTHSGQPVTLEPQVFDLLTLFVTRAGDLVTKDDILDSVWGGRIVSEAAISSRINAVRRAVGDDGSTQAILKTVPRRGFRLAVPVTAAGAEERIPAAGSGPQHIRIATSADGTAIAWTTTGNGPPLLRAGHYLTHLEIDWDSPVWRPLLDALGSRFSLTRYDQRGTGLSEPRVTDFSLDRHVEDLAAVADAAGLDRFPIFASSQGVPVALAYAARHPDRVSRMVLYGGYAQGRRLRGQEDQDEAEAILTFIRHGWGRSGTAFARAFVTTFMPDATAEQVTQMSRMQLASASPDNAVALRRAIDAFDVQDFLGQVRAPTLLVHCDEDAVHPVSQSRLIAARLPDAELRVIPGRNHVPLPQDPAWTTLVTAIRDFLA